MNPIIENHVSITKEIFQEWSQSSVQASYKKMIRKAGIFLLALFLLYTGWIISHGGSLSSIVTELLFMLFLYLYVGIYLPKSRRRTQYKNLCKASNGTPNRIVRFYADHLSVTTESGKLREFKYSQMRDVRETKSLYILANTTNTDIVLAKSGFTTGTAEQALELISSKKNLAVLEDTVDIEEPEDFEETEDSEATED